MNETKLETVNLLDLETACGGQNTTEASGNLGVDVPGKVKVGLQGDYKTSNTDYATCLSAMGKAGATPDQMAANCGKPSGSR